MLELIKFNLITNEYGKVSGSFSNGKIGGGFLDVDNADDNEEMRKKIIDVYSEFDKCHYDSEDLVFLNRFAKTSGEESVDVVYYVLNRKSKESSNSSSTQNIPCLINILESSGVNDELKSFASKKLKEIIERI